MLIISLSAIPARFPKIGPILDSLVNQTAQVDKILLYIPNSYRRFPDWDGSLPDVPEGVEIRRTDDDIAVGIAKFLGGAKHFGGRAKIIIRTPDFNALWHIGQAAIPIRKTPVAVWDI